jgi:hypothetical protein
MTSNPIARTVFLVALLGAFAGFFVYLYRTDGMIRFRQTNYACQSDMIGAFEVVLTRRREGAPVTIRRPAGEATTAITAVADGVVRFTAEGVDFAVDTASDAVTLSRDTAASRSVCRKSEFRM